jgi:integrase
MSYLRLERDAYDKLLPPEKDPKLIQADVCNFVSYLRKKGTAYASVSMYVAAIHKFYSMNDVILNWKKVYSFMGEHEKVSEDRPYTHSEIQTLLANTSLRNKAIILMMASAGLRIGAVPLLRIRDLESIDSYNIFKINVYSKSKRSAYFSFCTPECRAAIDQYLDHRKRWGERLADDSPLFRTDYNPQAVDRVVKPIGIDRIRHLVIDILRDTGLRKIPTEYSKYQPSHVMMNHGFRN